MSRFTKLLGQIGNTRGKNNEDKLFHAFESVDFDKPEWFDHKMISRIPLDFIPEEQDSQELAVIKKRYSLGARLKKDESPAGNGWAASEERERNSKNRASSNVRVAPAE